MATSASHVSSELRRGDLRPLPAGTSRFRQGVRVSRSSFGRVRVLADYDSERDASAAARVAAGILLAAGYDVAWSSSPYLFYATRA